MSTLAILKADIATMTDRTDISAQVPLFSKLARMELEATPMRPRFLLVKAASLPVNGNSFQIPVDAIGVQQISLVMNNTTTMLKRKTEAFVRANSNVQKYYWRDANSGYLGAKPSTTAVAEIDYFQRQPDLVNDADTNLWLLYGYDIFLRASLVQAYNYLKDSESAQYEKTILDQLIKDRINSYVALEHSDLSSEPGDL